MARNIPDYGERDGNSVPSKIQVAFLTAGPASTNDVVVAASGTYHLWSLDQPIEVIGLWTKVTTAFTAAVDLDIGDSGTVDRFSGSATIAATTAGSIWVVATGLTVPYTDTGAYIDLENDAATAAAGVLEVMLHYSVRQD